MTYFKTNVHVQPKSDKCVNLTEYKINPVVHSKSKFAFELISPPKPKKKGKRHRGDHNVTGSPYGTHSSHGQVERTKFVLIPDLEARTESLQREIRDKWVKSLRLAAKGPVLWDILLNLQCNDESGGTGPTLSSRSQSDHHHHHQSNHHHSAHRHHQHGGSDFVGSHSAGHHHTKHAQTEFTSSKSLKSGAYARHSHYGGNGGHSPVSGHGQNVNHIPNYNHSQRFIIIIILRSSITARYPIGVRTDRGLSSMCIGLVVIRRTIPNIHRRAARE